MRETRKWDDQYYIDNLNGWGDIDPEEDYEEGKEMYVKGKNYLTQELKR